MLEVLAFWSVGKKAQRYEKWLWNNLGWVKVQNVYANRQSDVNMTREKEESGTEPSKTLSGVYRLCT